MLGALIGAGASLLGGFMQQKGQKQQMAAQKQFAQQGIQWKVADAKKAGINPYYALGANTVSYTPQAVGDMGLSAAGQDIGRAVDAYNSPKGRATQFTQTVQKLQLQRMGLENQLLNAKIASLRQAGSPPGVPSPTDRYHIPGQPQSAPVGSNPIPGVTVGKPNALTKPDLFKQMRPAPEAPEQEPGANPDVGWRKTKNGWALVMSKAAKEASEEDVVSWAQWQLRNRLPAMTGLKYNPPPVPLKKGYQWYFNPVTGEYQQVKNTWYRPNVKGLW